MKKTIAAKEVLATIAIIEQALEAGDIDRVKLELQILVGDICDDEDEEYA
jgi:cobalamin biosynthesis protein CobD/CbiB